MFNSITPYSSGLSLTKIIGGLSKTLQIANQIIPIYQKAKPAIANARSIFKVIKEINTPDTKEKQTTNSNLELDSPKEQEKVLYQAPTFFL